MTSGKKDTKGLIRSRKRTVELVSGMMTRSGWLAARELATTHLSVWARSLQEKGRVAEAKGSGQFFFRMAGTSSTV